MEDKTLNNNMEAEYADVQLTESPYRVLKLVDGSDVLCKVLAEYTDALVVEVPMVVTRQKVYDKKNHLVEHTGLQKWMNFTNDIKFMISKEKLLGIAVLSQEVTLYYKMLANKLIEEQSLEPVEDDEIIRQLRENMDRLADIIGDGDEYGDDELVDPYYDDGKKVIH